MGFISDLPHELVAAFRATLEEVEQADLILHVRDVSNPETEAQKKDVEQVMAHILPNLGRSRMVEVWNKIDLLDDDTKDILYARAVTDRANNKPLMVSAIALTRSAISAAEINVSGNGRCAVIRVSGVG